MGKQNTASMQEFHVSSSDQGESDTEENLIKEFGGI